MDQKQGKQNYEGVSPTVIFYIAIGVLSVLIISVGFYLRPTKRQQVFTVIDKTLKNETKTQQSKYYIVSPQFSDELNHFLSHDVPTHYNGKDVATKEIFEKAYSFFTQKRYLECVEQISKLPKTQRYTNEYIRKLGARCFAGTGFIAYKFKVWQRASNMLGYAVLYSPQTSFLYEPYAESVCALGKTTMCKKLLLKTTKITRNNYGAWRMLFLTYLSDNLYPQAMRIWKICGNRYPELNWIAEIIKGRTRLDTKASYMEFPPTTSGFNIKIVGKADITEKRKLEEILSEARTKAAQFLQIDDTTKIPDIDLILHGGYAVFDFIHSNYKACDATLRATINMPIKTGSMENKIIQQAFANAYMQAIISKLSNKKAVCWLSSGLGAMFEEYFGWKYPEGGMHNLKPFIGAEQIRFSLQNLPPNLQEVFIPQSFAMTKTIVKKIGMKKLLMCINTASNSNTEFQKQLLKCTGFNNMENLIQNTAKLFGGRIYEK